MSTTYDFIGIDEGRQQIFRGSTSGSIDWFADLEDLPTARSLQKLDDERVLAGFDGGYFIIRIRDGAILHRCDRWEKVTSARRTPDGLTQLTGLGLDGRPGICVLSLDAEDAVVDSVRRRGGYVRLMRDAPAPDGRVTWLLGMNRRILETDTRLRKKRVLRAPGFLHAWMARRLENGETLVSAGYGAFMARFDARGRLTQVFGGTAEVPEEVRPNFYASFDITGDGSILVANWQGHGPDRGATGRQLLRFSTSGDYLESWSFPGVSSFQGLLLI